LYGALAAQFPEEMKVSEPSPDITLKGKWNLALEEVKKRNE